VDLIYRVVDWASELERRACVHAAGVTSCCCLPVLPIPSSGFVRACGEQTRCRRAAHTRLLEPAGVLLKAHASHCSRHEFRAGEPLPSALCRAVVVGRARGLPRLHAWGSAPKGMSFGIGQPNNRSIGPTTWGVPRSSVGRCRSSTTHRLGCTGYSPKSAM
jgi:hypothetical protein